MVSEPNGGSVLQFVYVRIDNADAVEESKSDCDIYLANGGIEEERKRRKRRRSWAN